MTRAFSDILKGAVSGSPLKGEIVEQAFAQLFAGTVDPVQAGAFLTALKVRGETTEEIAAAATAMRAAAISFDGPEGTIDTCGTGGDGANTYNISTATAIVLSACGVPVAKHGNKAVSSASGSSDVLSALGVDIHIGPEGAKACLDATGIAFLFAPHHHPAVRHVAPIRQALGVRTLFNLLGPLTNPARAKRQLMGVYEQSLTRPIAETLHALGAEAAWVVHGDDGLDELTVTGQTHVSELIGGVVRDHKVGPADFGLDAHAAEDLTGGDAETNADAIRTVFAGGLPAYRDAIAINAAAGLIIAGAETEKKAAAARALHAIDSRAAQDKLSTLAQFTNEYA